MILSTHSDPLFNEFSETVRKRSKEAFDTEMELLWITKRNASEFKVEVMNYVGRGNAYTVKRNWVLVSQFFVDYLWYRKIFPWKNSES